MKAAYSTTGRGIESNLAALRFAPSPEVLDRPGGVQEDPGLYWPPRAAPPWN
jgi:hypothetical protein